MSWKFMIYGDDLAQVLDDLILMRYGLGDPQKNVGMKPYQRQASVIKKKYPKSKIFSKLTKGLSVVDQKGLFVG